MRKKNESTGWIAASLTFCAIMLFVYLFVSNSNEFTVKYEMEHVRDGYETSPASVTIYASPAIKWGEVSAGWKVAGWISFVLIAVGNFLAWKWDYKLGSLGTPWKRLALCFVPILACAICWLASYSSRLDLGAYNAPFDQFKEEMKISDALASKIKEEGGTGVLLIKDENGLLTKWFKK